MKKLGLVRIGDEPEQHFILQRGTRNNKNRTNPNTLLISIEREPNKIRIYTELSVLIVFSTQQMIQGNRILRNIERCGRKWPMVNQNGRFFVQNGRIQNVVYMRK